MKKTYAEIQLERIANALEAIAFPVKEEKPQEEPQKEEVEELVKEEPLETPEAEKEQKEEPLIKEKEVKESEVKEIPIEEASKIIEEDGKVIRSLPEPLEEPVIKVGEEKYHEEPKVEPVKRADSRRKIREVRINPYRIKEQPKKGSSSGFRIKED